MSEPAVELVGADRFSRTVGDAIGELQDMSEAGQQAVDLLERQAKPRTPRRTGELVSSFGGRVTATAAELVNTADHARFVNFGTRHMDAQPFMPTDVEDVVLPVYVDAVGEAIHQIEGK